MSVLRALWDKLTRLMEPVGHFVSRMIVLPLLYWGLGAVFTWPTRASDPLHLRPKRRTSFWVDRREEPAGRLDDARNMY